MKLKFFTDHPFREGWRPKSNLDPTKIWYAQPELYWDYKVFLGEPTETSLWKNDRLWKRQQQYTPLIPIINDLQIRNLVSIGAGTPIIELMCAKSCPKLTVVATDIHISDALKNDLATAPEHGFPASVTCATLDIGNPSTFSPLQGADAVLIVSAFFVVDDPSYATFIAACRKAGIRYIILWSDEELSFIGSVLYCMKWGLQPWRRRLWLGYLRTKGHVKSLFHPHYALSQHRIITRRNSILEKIGLHYNSALHVFLIDR